MLIITNPGSNLSPKAIERYRIQVMPQQIIVDGDAKDTRAGISHAVIDGWVKTAKQHPYVVGTTAAEFMSAFRAAARSDREILVIMTSRKIIGSHDAAVIAAKALLEQQGMADMRVEVVDTGFTDLAAGMACVLAGEARNAGLDIKRIAAVLDTYRRHATFGFTVSTFDYVVKGGRATVVRAFLGNLLGVRPVISLVDGEVAVVEKISAKSDPALEMVSWLEKKLGRGRRIWAGVFHGSASHHAVKVTAELRRRFDVAFVWNRELSPSIYLHSGPGSVGVTAMPLDVLPFTPGTPPNLD